jgi:hypothetical protein
LAKIVAKRCLECGIIEMDNGIYTEDSTTKVKYTIHKSTLPNNLKCCYLGWKLCKNNGGRGNIIERA